MTHEEMIFRLLHEPVQMGWLSALLALAPLASKLFGGASKARAEARVAESGLNAGQDKMAIDRAVVDNNLTQSKQDDAIKNGLRAGLKDFSVNRPAGVPGGKMTGGLRPSAITNGNKLGQQFQDADLASIMAGTPALTPPPKAGKFDKFLNIAGGIAGLAGLAGQAKSAFGGASDMPDIDPNVATDPTAFLKTLPSINTAISAPVQSTYRRPTFTSRF